MTTETHPKDVDKDKQRIAGAISVAIFLISLGVLLLTGWWWPGIMVAIGLSSGASLIFRGRIWQGILSLAFFCSIPIAIWIINETKVSWTLVGGFILIGLGVITIIKVFFFREE